MNTEELERRVQEGRRYVVRLISSPRVPFRGLTPAKLPSKAGIYLITTADGEALRAGRTDKQTLADRVYRNHLMGNQAGNLRSQLVQDGTCNDLEQAKQWVRDNCHVQCVELSGGQLDQRWAEHFVLSVVRPRFSN